MIMATVQGLTLHTWYSSSEISFKRSACVWEGTAVPVSAACTILMILGEGKRRDQCWVLLLGSQQHVAHGGAWHGSHACSRETYLSAILLNKGMPLVTAVPVRYLARSAASSSAMMAARDVMLKRQECLKRCTANTEAIEQMEKVLLARQTAAAEVRSR
jgi:hypothetical protein